MAARENDKLSDLSKLIRSPLGELMRVALIGYANLKFQRYECLDFESFERENTEDGAGFDVQYVAM